MTEFLNASFVIQVHVAFAVIAFVAGPIALVRRKRDRLHKTVGYVFALALCGTAFSSFFIHTIRLIGPFSPIHILSIITPISLFFAIRAIRAKDVKRHKSVMWRLYSQAMGIAGLFTFLPGRLMNEMIPFFDPWTVFFLACALFGLFIFTIWSAIAPRAAQTQNG